MKSALVILPLALLTTGCSELLYPGLRRPMVSPYPRRIAAPPLPVGRWDNVMRLPQTSTIDVLTADGVPTVGAIAGATAQTVTLRLEGGEVTIARAEIVRVDLVDLPGSETGAVVRRAARGAVLGAAAVTVVGAVIGGPAWPPPGVLVRAGIAGGAAAGGQAAIASRQGRILYLAANHGSAAVPYWPTPEESELAGEPFPGRYALPACAQTAGVAGIDASAPSWVIAPASRHAAIGNAVGRAAGARR